MKNIFKKYKREFIYILVGIGLSSLSYIIYGPLYDFLNGNKALIYSYIPSKEVFRHLKRCNLRRFSRLQPSSLAGTHLATGHRRRLFDEVTGAQAVFNRRALRFNGRVRGSSREPQHRFPP